MVVLAAAALRLAAAVSEPTTVPFDVRPGGVVHSFSQDVGPGVCVKPPAVESTSILCTALWTAGIGGAGLRVREPWRPVRMAGAAFPEAGMWLAHSSPVSHSLPARQLPFARLFLEKGVLADKSSGSRGQVVQVARGLLSELGLERKHPKPYTDGSIDFLLSGCEASSQPSLCDGCVPGDRLLRTLL